VIAIASIVVAMKRSVLVVINFFSFFC